MAKWRGRSSRRGFRSQSLPGSVSLPSGIPQRAGLAGLGDILRSAVSNSAAVTTIAVFILLTAITTTMLMLPVASEEGTPTPLPDALFTAVSAICVTGLTTVNMATYWSPFGHTVVFLAMQIGGIGVMTLATLLAVLASRRLGLGVRKILASDIDPSRMHERSELDAHGMKLGDVRGLLGTVVISVVVIEIALSLIIIPRLWFAGLSVWESIWQGVYLATSAFTNTGFVPLVSGLGPFESDPVIVFTLGLGVFLGSIGFPVIFALTRALSVARKRRRGQTLQHARIGLHAKLTLSTTLILLVIGALLIGLLEWGNERTLGGQDLWVRPMTAVFTSMMARSGGFNTVPTDEMSGATLLVLDMLMFVGGGSASTAGGIKVTTLAILFLAAFAEARGDQDLSAYERRIPSDTVRLAVSVVLWGASIVAVSTILILRVTDAPLDKVLFDVISAFATCGLSAGLTSADLDPEAKYILAVTMLLGRVGTVTLATAISGTHRQTVYRRAAERPIVG
jgi:trk system potassium uptake protein TrkH